MAVFDIMSGPFGRLMGAIYEYVGDTMPNITEGLSNVLARNAQKIWQQEAERTPTGWGVKYADAIKMEPASGGFARVYIDESESDPRTGKPTILFVNMVEEGMKSFSIKMALLKSDRVHISAKGTRYIHVPFRWRVPVKNQKASSGFAGTMPKEIYNIVKGGGRIGEYSMSTPTGKMASLAGLQKYGSGGHSQYMTFRTVTEDSKGWIHPGKRATPVYEKVLPKVERMIENYLMEFLKAYGQGIRDRVTNK